MPNTIINKAYENVSNGKLIIGAQNCHHEESGAFTGDVSAEMLKNAGAKVIIVGHSERRQNYYENNELINKKATSVINSGLQVIICIGETEEEKNMMIDLGCETGQGYLMHRPDFLKSFTSEKT